MSEKKYGGEDFGFTLAKLKTMAPLAQELSGVNFSGDTRKVAAILGFAGVSGELVAEIEAQRATLAKFIEHYAQIQRGDMTEGDKVDNDLGWFAAVAEAKALIGGVQAESEAFDRFAKLYTFADIGQVLVKLDEEDDGPEVRLYFHPKELGVCSVKFGFNDEPGNTEWEKAERAFGLIDRALAEKIVRKTLEAIPAGLAE